MRLENHIAMLEMHDLVPFKVSEKLYSKKKKKKKKKYVPPCKTHNFPNMLKHGNFYFVIICINIRNIRKYCTKQTLENVVLSNFLTADRL